MLGFLGRSCFLFDMSFNWLQIYFFVSHLTEPVPAYSPDFNLAEYEIHLLRLQKLHHLSSNVTIAEIEQKLKDVKILMNSEQIYRTLEHIFALV